MVIESEQQSLVLPHLALGVQAPAGVIQIGVSQAVQARVFTLSQVIQGAGCQIGGIFVAKVGIRCFHFQETLKAGVYYIRCRRPAWRRARQPKRSSTNRSMMSQA